jgi:hypothetical protein
VLVPHRTYRQWAQSGAGAASLLRTARSQLRRMEHSAMASVKTSATGA